MARQFKRLDPALRERIASYPLGPLVPLEQLTDERHARLLESLIDAVDGKGLPRVAGFTFDPEDLHAVLGAPRPSAQSGAPVALHPRLGTWFGSSRCTLSAPVYEWDHLDLPSRFEAGTSLGESCADALAWLIDLDRARMRRWALWLSLGPPLPAEPFTHEPALHGRFGSLEWMFRGARNAQVAALAEALGLASDRGVRFHAGGTNVLWRLGAELLLCTDDDALLDKALRCASAQRMPVLPDSLSGARPWSERGVMPAAGAPYAVRLPHWQQTYGLHVEREPGNDGPSVFAFSQDEAVYVRRPVAPGTVARGEWPALDGATPCLRRHLGRRAIQRDPALRDLDAVKRFVATEAAGWECLIEVEEVLGGLDLKQPEAQRGPDFLGVFAVLARRDELERRTTYAPDDGPVRLVTRPWPFFVSQGRELVLAGMLRERCDVWLCVDREGVLCRLYTEFDMMQAEAASPRVMLETWAFQDAQFMPLDAIGRVPALGIDAALDDALLDGFGLRAIAEASDRIGRWDLGAGVLVRRRFAFEPVQRAGTIVYTADPAVAIEIARRARAHSPGTRMHVHGGVGPLNESRVAAFRASDLHDVPVRGWSDFAGF